MKSKYRYIIWQSITTKQWHLSVKSRANGKVIMTTEGYKSKKSAETVFDNLYSDFGTNLQVGMDSLEYHKVPILGVLDI